MNLTIGLWNANGLQATAIDDVLQHSHSFDLLFITETWLLPPVRLPTTWKQHHNYGRPVQGNFRGSMGISLLVSPSSSLDVTPLPILNEYMLAVRLHSFTIVCCYFPPSLPNDTVLSYLESIPLTSETIICGDFNARMAETLGDSTSNPRGREIAYWLTSHQLHLWNAQYAYGTPTFHTFRNNQVHASIIDIVMSNFPPEGGSMTIYQDLSLGSDHLLLSFTFTFPASNPHPSPPTTRKTWHLSRLQEDEPREYYVHLFETASAPLRDRLQALLDHPPAARPDIDDMSDQLNDLIYSALSQSVGDRPSRPKHWKWFWTAELAAAAARRNHHYRRWRKAVGVDKAEWWNLYRTALFDFRRDVKRARRQAYRAFCDALELNFAKATSKIKAIRRRRQQSPSFTHPDGPATATTIMAQQLSSVCDGRFLPTQRPMVPPPLRPPHDLDHSPFTITAVTDVIHRLPNRKAPGADHLRAEMLKPIVEPLVMVLQPLYQLCWMWSYTPPAWRHAQVCPIFKKGDPSLASNYRPISLTSILRKVMEYCIAPMLRTQSPSLDMAQGGFRPQRSALDQALCLHEIMHMFRVRHHRPPTVAFLDIKSAYDTVDRRVVWNALYQANTHPPLISLLQNLFDEVSSSVVISNHLSPPSPLPTGVLQGSVLSPHLYSIYINTLPSLLRQVSSSLPITVADPPIVINSLLFADDVAIIGTPSEVQQMLNIASTHSFQLGYRWSPTKCAVLNAPTHRSFTLYDQVLPTVEEFVYLGLPFRQAGLSTEAMIRHRSPGTLLAMSVLQTIGARPSGFSPLLSARLYRQFIRPKFEYGLAILRLRGPDLKSLTQLQDRCLRMIMGGHRTSSTSVFRHLCDLPSIHTRAYALSMKFCVRLQFLPEDCLITLLSPLLPPHSRLSFLRSNPMFVSLPSSLPRDIKQAILDHRQSELDLKRQTQTLLYGARPRVGVDPILQLKTTRHERSRLLRWRIGWLPGKPRDCPCGSDHTSRRHLVDCPVIPRYLWQQLPVSPSDTHPLDNALSQLPTSSRKPPAYWQAVLTLLAHIDEICLLAQA